MIRAIYPGTFDPVTNGHLDIAFRAAALFEEVIMAVYHQPNKNPLFSIEERVSLIKEATRQNPKIKVMPFSGLLVDFARSVGAKVIIRGLRATIDFEREFEMALMNKKLYPDIEIVCLMTALEYQFLSSSGVKEVASLGGSVEGLVPPNVAMALREKFAKKGGEYGV